MLNANMMPMGEGHHPRIRPRNLTSETAYREYVAVKRPEMVRLWNSYFDEHGVDLIMTPPQRAIVTYTDAAASTVQVRTSTCSSCPYRDVPSSINEAAPFYAMFKEIPIPKLLVPTGLDQDGRPTGILFWGRAVPSDSIDNATFAKTFDLGFLYRVKTLLDLIQAEPTLKRAHAPLVADLFEHVTSESSILL
mmetsp:Transcript_59394/g.111906  ORF Transcript_59394/g.111906 Transcript_59394/m.111906 type:complete len:192 (+) Transcript_59394:51-626(+)